ncbi:TIR domain-containing protein [Streptomyces sp. NPDC006134]|uniref:toll/interleukin-1 receptor domain-containing protein n=1 Tax=Streptomyces sp. NPDC006134 TaxID=3154467 RepID=UPI0033FD1F2B
MAREAHSSPDESTSRERRPGIKRTAAWLASCLVSWALFYPFFGPSAALLGLYVPLFVYFPGPSPVAIWKAGKIGKLQASWAWQRLLRPEALAVPFATAVALAWQVTVAPSGSFFFWEAVTLLPLGIGGTAWWAGIQITVEGVPLGQEDIGRGGRRSVRTSGWFLATHALVAAGIAGGGAWVLRTVGRPLAFGTAEVAPAMEQVGDAVRWLDAQFSASLFGPTYEHQQYWVGLVVGAGLLAALSSALLRDLASRLGTTSDPFSDASSELRTDAPLPEATGKVFLSYSRKDGAVARGIRESLEGKLRHVWVDWEAIEPSEKWRQAIDEGIRTSDAFILLVSEDSLRSPYCRDECMKAIDLHKRILPVIIDPNLATGVTAAMNEHGWEPLRSYQSFHMIEGSDEDPDRGIQRIVTFVTQRHRWDAFHTRLGNLAHEWWESGCKDGLLLRAEELALAEKWQEHPWGEEHEIGLTEREIRYLSDSRRAAKRRARRLRAGVAVVTAAVVGLSSLAVSAQGDAENQRRTALSRKLASASLGLSKTEPEKAVQLALAAYGQESTAEAQSALAAHLANLNKVRTIIPPKKGVVSRLSFSPDGGLLFIERDYGNVQIWDANTARSRGTLQGTLLSWGDGGARSLTADGKTLALRTGQHGEQVDLVDTDSLQIKESFSVPRTGGTGSIGDSGGGLSPNGKILMAGGVFGAGASIAVWDVPNHRTLKVISCDVAEMAPSGKTVTCGREGRVQVLGLPDLRTRQTISTSGWSFEGYTTDDGVVVNYGETADLVGEARVYEPGSSRPWIPSKNMSLNYGLLMEDGRHAVVHSPDMRRWELWDLKSHKRLRTTTGQKEAAHAIRAEAPVEPQYSDTDGDRETATADGKRVATVTKDGSVVIWERTTTGRLAEHHALPKAKAPFNGFAVSPSTNTFATADSQQPVVQLRDSRTGTLTGTIRLAETGTTLAFNKDGSLLAVAERAGTAQRSPVEVFEVPSGRHVAQMHYTPGLKSGLPTLLFSPDSRELYGTLQGESRVAKWDLSTGYETHSYGPDPVSEGFADQAALSGDGAMLALTDRQQTVSLWDTATGNQLSFKVRNAKNAALSPDGRVLATVGEDNNGDWGGGSVTLWDVTTQEKIGTSLVPEGGVSRVLFSPDGLTLAVVGDGDVSDVALSLWDVASHRKVGPDLFVTQRDASVGFSPDATRIDVADGNGITRIRVDPSAWAAALCGMLTGPLSNSDWQDAAPREHYRSPC